MTDDKITREQKLVFGYSPATKPGAPTCLLIGLPTAAWEYMKDGKTHTLDLTSIGVPIQLVVFGCKDQEEARKWVEEHNKRQGLATLDARRKDFGIKPRSD